MNSWYRRFAAGLQLAAVATLLFCATFTRAEKVEDLPKPTDYVNDYAHVLSADAVARLDRFCAELDHTGANAQVAVITIHNLDGDDAADFASRLEDKWHMGKKGSDRGVLLLLAVDDHQYRIDVGYGLEGILPDGKIGDIGREMRVDLRRADYDDAVLQAVGQIGQVIAEDAHVTLDEQPGAEQMPQRVHRGHPFGGLILFIIIFVLFGGSWISRLLFGAVLFNNWRGGGWGGGSWGSGGGWGGGGGLGGGGGGGGGFGGFGGGSFGGGGAGGSW